MRFTVIKIHLTGFKHLKAVTEKKNTPHFLAKSLVKKQPEG